jgi:hypothetical protein
MNRVPLLPPSLFSGADRSPMMRGCAGFESADRRESLREDYFSL